MKRQIWTHPLLEDEAALRQSVVMMAQSLQPGNADFKEGVQSFLQKRQPKFDSLNMNNPVLVTADMLIKGPGAKL
jgi:hypothetical protein